jgi:hypothetical protein
MVLRLSSFPNDVRASTLTGLATGTAAPILATDSRLIALAKLQAQLGGLTAASFTNPNWFINSDNSVNQRNVGGADITATGYMIDGWKLTISGGDAANGGPYQMSDYDRYLVNQPDIEWGPQCQVTTANTTTGLTTISSYVRDVYRTAGQWNTVSGWAYVDTGSCSLGLYATQNKGTSGGTAVNTYIGTQSVPNNNLWNFVSWSWQMPAVTGTVSGGNDYSSINFALSAGSNNTALTGIGPQQCFWNLALMKWEPSTTHTPWQKDPAEQVMRDCQRRYYPITNFQLDGYNGASNQNHPTIIFPSTMEAVPTCTITGTNTGLNATPTLLTGTTADRAVMQYVKSTGAGAFSSSYKLEFSNEL